MANVLFSGTSLTLGTGSTDTYIVGDASDGVVGTILVHLDTTSAGTVSVVVKARPRSVPWADTTPPFLPIPYLSLCDGGTVVAGATYATAALTGDGDLILVPASGLSIALDVTYTSGTHVLRVERLVGASA
jgi:hypothetical protein